MKNLIFLLAIAFSCQSCVTTEQEVAIPIPTEATMLGHNFGSMNDAKALQMLKAWGDSQFKDPYSVKYKITQSPRQGWGRGYRLPPWLTNKPTYNAPKIGWVFKASTNAKNLYGAYTGIQEHVYLISGGKVTRLTEWFEHTSGMSGSIGLGAVGKLYGYR